MRSFPLSPQQRALWLLMQLIPDPRQQCALNLCYQLALRGPLDARALAEAIRQLGRRHAALRMRIWAEGDDLRQAACGDDLAVCMRDLRGQDDAWSAADSIARAEAARAIDPAVDPVAWFTLVRLGDEDFRLVITAHHLVADAASMYRLRDDLAGLYASAIAPRRLAAPDAPRAPEARGAGARPDDSYQAFVAAQLDRERTDAFEACGAWWIGQLAGDLPALDLPSHAPYPAVRSFRGDSVIVPLERTLLTACRRASFRQRVPLSVFLLAAFARLLAQRAGQPRMILGTHFAGRDGGRWRDTVGLFTNTVPVILQIDPDAGESEIVRHVYAQFVGAYEHQDYSLQRLLERLPITRGLSRPALFQVVFAYQDWDSFAQARAWPGVTETAFEHVATPTSMFELQLHVVAASGGTVAKFDYATDVLSREAVAATAEAYCDLLAHPC